MASEKKKRKADTFPSRQVMREESRDPAFEPDWEDQCGVCGMSPTVPIVGLCGPCTWGEAETIGGNW